MVICTRRVIVSRHRSNVLFPRSVEPDTVKLNWFYARIETNLKFGRREQARRFRGCDVFKQHTVCPSTLQRRLNKTIIFTHTPVHRRLNYTANFSVQLARRFCIL